MKVHAFLLSSSFHLTFPLKHKKTCLNWLCFLCLDSSESLLPLPFQAQKLWPNWPHVWRFSSFWPSFVSYLSEGRCFFHSTYSHSFHVLRFLSIQLNKTWPCLAFSLSQLVPQESLIHNRQICLM